jgi:crotonobetainyl-CoA:carnitine CoA-transferase CaiB-like acyl-CoA transferase
MSYEQPYRGLKVVDLSQGYAGPYCAMLLALYGADVIKIEPPEGDWIRILGTRYGDQTAHGMAVSRGKRSLALDLKSKPGLEITKRLAQDCDIFIESYRPGVAERLGLGYETVKANNPRVLYVSVSGYGHSGPYARRPLTDTVAQAMSGIMAANRGNDGIPHKTGFLIVDAATGLYAFQAVAAALYARTNMQVGRHIDVSLLQSAAALQCARIGEYQLEGGTPKLLNAPAGSYRSKDGWLAITLVKEEHFVRLCRVLGLDHLPADECFCNFAARARHIDELRTLIQQVIEQRCTQEWVERFTEADVMSQPINDYGDWLADPHVQAVNAAPLVEQPGVGAIPVPNIPGLPALDPEDPRQLAPRLGEHTLEILRELGYSDETIEEWTVQQWVTG